MDNRYKLKVVMLGDFAVGKTSLVNRYVHNIFDERYLTTLGARISKKDVHLSEGPLSAGASLILWDLNGDDGFHDVLPQYLKGAAGAIVVADATRSQTVESLAKHAEMFERRNPGGIVVASCNKIDLVDGERRAAVLRTTSVAAPVPADRVFFTSAKDATDVEAMFVALASLLVSRLRDG
jgi:small GTP-binding protein